jgi:hypothetical protein
MEEMKKRSAMGSRLVRSIALGFIIALGPSLPSASAELFSEDEAKVTAQAGYGRVFGRIVLIEEGKEKNH